MIFKKWFQNRLVVQHRQTLFKEYLPILEVFYMNNSVYCMMVKKEADGLTMPGIFKLHQLSHDFQSQ